MLIFVNGMTIQLLTSTAILALIFQFIRQNVEEKGRVDAIDHLLSSYRPIIRGKKWYWSLIKNAINASVIAAWRVHCAFGSKSLTHLDFCRSITL